MLDHQFLDSDVEFAVTRDLDAFKSLLIDKQVVNLLGSEFINRLVLAPAGVRRVLIALAAQEIPPSVVQAWASFVRRGFIAPVGKERISPLEIDYESANEDEIVEIIHRLNQLGDLIDGEVTADEIGTMLRTLPP